MSDGADPRWTHLSWGDATLLSSHAGDPRRRRATRQKPVRPKGRQAKRESARRQPRDKPTSRTTPDRQDQVLTEANSGSSWLRVIAPAFVAARVCFGPLGERDSVASVWDDGAELPPFLRGVFAAKETS